jgi:parvulin-like peptidyl-prolyl isomerase
MDAATPLRRWLRTVGLLAAVGGCRSAGAQPVAPPPPAARSQAPVAPPSPTPPAVPGSPVGPVQPVGYTPGGPGAIRPAVVEGSPRVKVVAQVGARNIVTDREVWEAVRQHPDWPKAVQLVGTERDVREKELYRAALRAVIDRELILDEMEKILRKNNKLAAMDELKEVAGKIADQRIREIKRMNKMKSDEEFQAVLAFQEMTLPVFRRAIERQAMAEEFVRSLLKEKGVKPGMAEVREYFDKHPDEFKTPDRVKWLDIFVGFGRFATPRDAYDHAEAVRRLAASGTDFAGLSKQYDQGFAAQQNGEGAGTERGKIQPPDVEPALWALQPGQVSNLIETPTGYHIVKVLERQVAGVRKFDEKTQADVRAKLREQAVKQEREKMLAALWRKGTVRVIDNP